MKLLLDCRKINDGGIGRYLKGVLSSLEHFKKEVQVTLLTGRGEGVSLPFNKIESEISSYSVREFFKLFNGVRKTDFDLIHIPHYTVPFKCEVPVVSTIHDLIHITYPERWWYPIVARRYILHALSQSRKVVAVSRATQNELNRLSNGKFRDKIIHLLNPVDEKFLKNSNVRATNHGYLLLVSSNLKPHKGALEFLEDYEALSKIRDLPEVIHVGERAEGIQGSWYCPVEKVSDEELLAFYRSAKSLIIPSYVEGFCYPMLEAALFQVPVVCRPIEVLKELSPYTKTIFAADLSREAFMKAVLEGIALSDQNVEEREINTPKEFTPQSTGEKLIQVYKEAVK